LPFVTDHINSEVFACVQLQLLILCWAAQSTPHWRYSNLL